MKKRIIISVMLAIFSVSVFGTEFFVYPGDSIQEAINDAYSGDIITVADGEYFERLFIENKSLTLRSESGNQEECIINGENFGDIIDVNGSCKF